MINGNENGNMVMPVSPMGGYGCNGGFGSDWGSWIILFLIFGMFGNGGWGNNGTGSNGQFPWLLAANRNNENATQAGFNQAALSNQLSGIQTSITNGFANAEVASCNRALTDLQAQHASEISNLTQMNTLAASLQNCCCENRQSTANLKADLLQAMSSGFQSIKDDLCADRLAAAQRENADLRTQLQMAQLKASQTDQTAAIQAGQRALANEIEQYVLPTPRPAYVVANPNCCQTSYGCGCGA